MANKSFIQSHMHLFQHHTLTVSSKIGPTELINGTLSTQDFLDKHICSYLRSRTMYGNISRTKTDHMIFRNDLADNPICQQFGSLEETIEHFIGRYPRYNRLRLELFGNNTIRTKEFHTLDPKSIFYFMKKSKK